MVLARVPLIRPEKGGAEFKNGWPSADEQGDQNTHEREQRNERRQLSQDGEDTV